MRCFCDPTFFVNSEVCHSVFEILLQSRIILLLRVVFVVRRLVSWCWVATTLEVQTSSMVVPEFLEKDLEMGTTRAPVAIRASLDARMRRSL